MKRKRVSAFALVLVLSMLISAFSGVVVSASKDTDVVSGIASGIFGIISGNIDQRSSDEGTDEPVAEQTVEGNQIGYVKDVISSVTGGIDGYDGDGEFGLVIWGLKGSATVSYLGISKVYFSGINLPGFIPITVTFEEPVASVEKAVNWTVDGAVINEISENGFTFTCYPLNGSQANFKVVMKGEEEISEDDPVLDPIFGSETSSRDESGEAIKGSGYTQESKGSSSAGTKVGSQGGTQGGTQEGSKEDSKSETGEGSKSETKEDTKDRGETTGTKTSKKSAPVMDDKSSNPPKTADTTVMIMWVAAIVFSAGAAAFVLLRKKAAE